MKLRFLALLSFLPVLSFASLLARSSDLQAPVAVKPDFGGVVELRI